MLSNDNQINAHKDLIVEYERTYIILLPVYRTQRITNENYGEISYINFKNMRLQKPRTYLKEILHSNLAHSNLLVFCAPPESESF